MECIEFRRVKEVGKWGGLLTYKQCRGVRTSGAKPPLPIYIHCMCRDTCTSILITRFFSDFKATIKIQ